MASTSQTGADQSTPRKTKLRLEKKRLQTRLWCLQKQQSESKASKGLKKSRAKAKANAIAVASEFLSGPALDFFKSQIQMSDRGLKGKRWSEQMKMFALSLFHTSPKCYRMLRKIFSLPGISTLKLVVRFSPVHPKCIEITSFHHELHS